MTTFVEPAPALTTQAVPGYLTGTWDLDHAHSEVAFSVRHLMVSKVRGRFAAFSGSFVTAENPLDSSVEATIDLSSIDTNSADRDAHLRSADFFDVDQHPSMTYRSTGIRANGARWIVDGELSLHGVTLPVPLQLELHGFLPDSPFGDSRVGFTATGEINRDDFGITFNSVLESGGLALGNTVQITLEIEAVRRND
jgi:polyisoprenoid-binding protein YceI